MLTAGRVTVHGPIEDLVARHVLLTGPGGDEAGLAAVAAGAVEIRRVPRQITVLRDGPPPVLPEGWTTATPTLEEVVVARLRAAAGERAVAA